MKVVHFDSTDVYDAVEMSGIELVRFAIKHDWANGYTTLIGIIGRLIDRLPEEDRLAVCGLEHRMAKS